MTYPIIANGVGHRLLRAQEDLLSQMVDGPKHVVDLFRGLEDEKTIKVISLKMNGQHQILDCEVVGMGESSDTLIQPRVIVRGALGALVETIILVLNHPESSAEPTPAELEAYGTLVELGEVLGFEVLDMVIVSKDDWFSVADSQTARS